MADFEWHLGNFEKNSRGIIEVWKSRGMQDALSGVAEKLRDDANSMGHAPNNPDNAPLYRGYVTLADRTAFGHVRTNGLHGAIDQATHHTLDALNH
jgi:hypothetical protein